METLESGCVDASESPRTREEEGEVSMAGVWRVWRDGGMEGDLGACAVSKTPAYTSITSTILHVESVYKYL